MVELRVFIETSLKKLAVAPREALLIVCLYLGCTRFGTGVGANTPANAGSVEFLLVMTLLDKKSNVHSGKSCAAGSSP